jgi:hypothetical protein
VIIPKNKETGVMTVSPSMLRRYGAAGFYLDSQEESMGCPRQYRLWYVDKADRGEKAPELLHGIVVHRALHLMEVNTLGPEEALKEAWSESPDFLSLGPEHYAEALKSLTGYVERESSPMDRFAGLANEVRMSARLYDDDDFGPVDIQGVVDRISTDYDDPTLIHATDFKTNRYPPSVEEVKKDLQAKTYPWLIYRNLDKLNLGDAFDQPKVIFHLDAINWRELPGVYFSEADLEEWHDYVVAIVRAILRDKEGAPVLNPGCARCPFKVGCPAYESLPNGAEDLLKVKPADREALADWLRTLSTYRLLLKKAEDEANDQFAQDAMTTGLIEAGVYRWERVPRLVAQLDTRRLHELLGDEFYDLVTVTQTALEGNARGRAPSTAAEILECLRKEPDGTKIKKSRI